MTILIVLTILISPRLSYVYFLLDVLLFCNNTLYRLNHPVKIMKTSVIFTITMLEMSLALDNMGPCGRKVQTDTSMDFHKVILINFEYVSLIKKFSTISCYSFPLCNHNWQFINRFQLIDSIFSQLSIQFYKLCTYLLQLPVHYVFSLVIQYYQIQFRYCPYQ